MRIPKRISELLNEKQDYIDLNRTRLERSIVRLQSELLDKIIAEIIPNLDIKDGIIQDTTHNYRLLADLDNVYKDFTNISTSVIASQVFKATDGIVRLTEKYMKSVIPDLPARFDKIILTTANKMNVRIGLGAKGPTQGGFLESIIKDNTVNTQIKNYVSKSITGQINTKEFISGLKDMIKGVPKKVLRDGQEEIIRTGAIEKQYQRYAYDLYQQYDRAYNTSLGQEFGMKYFIYQGGLIEDSRDFCVAHNNKVWTEEEASEWDVWMPYMGEYPAGYEIKQKNIYEIPSYLGYPGYQPMIDLGGYRCRHSIGYISDELAQELRPELK